MRRAQRLGVAAPEDGRTPPSLRLHRSAPLLCEPPSLLQGRALATDNNLLCPCACTESGWVTLGRKLRSVSLARLLPIGKAPDQATINPRVLLRSPPSADGREWACWACVCAPNITARAERVGRRADCRHPGRLDRQSHLRHLRRSRRSTWPRQSASFPTGRAARV